MSTETGTVLDLNRGGLPELSAVGKRIEVLRIERGLSKQFLARYAGTSRQQLWRVMTGKSELTTTLRTRLAEVLEVDPRALQEPEVVRNIRLYHGARAEVPARAAVPFAEYVVEPELLVATLRTLPADDAGRRLKREYLNCLEEIATELGIALPGAFFELRGRVVNGLV